MLYPTTVISIDTWESVNLVSSLSWKNIQVYEILLGRSRKPGVSLFRVKNLTWIHNIVFEIQMDGQTRDIVVEEDIMDGICRYFRWNPEQDDDCLWFIAQILGWKKWSRYVDEGIFSYIGLDDYDAKNMQSWDVIFMVSSDPLRSPESWYYHYALYLGEGLYLSKLWFWWRVVITTFEQLQNCNDELDSIFKLQLKKK